MKLPKKVPKYRFVKLNEHLENPKGSYILYWMQSTRRTKHNYALEFAIETANEMRKQVIVYEGLTYNYKWACDRYHQFVLEGVAGTRSALLKLEIPYFFYLQQTPQSPRGVLSHLAKDAVLIVTDDFPCGDFPLYNQVLAKKVKVPVYSFDSNGIIPLRYFTREQAAARSMRYKISRVLLQNLEDWVPTPTIYSSSKYQVQGPWTKVYDKPIPQWVKECAIDHNVKPHWRFKGGRDEGLFKFETFMVHGGGYSEKRNDPGVRGTSELSPYFHYGFLSPLEVAIEAKANKTFSAFERDTFLEELITHRELGFNYTLYNSFYKSLEGLPKWAQETLVRHAKDPRPHIFSLEEFENSRTHDDLWNAAQTELVISGRMHSHLRQMWGKKILEWSKSPKEALDIMIHLNNKYSLDGRDPNSYAGILYCLGLHDRPWAPDREIFGNIRNISEKHIKEKIDWEGYANFVASLHKNPDANSPK